jgi:predicted polyphosphate/ATP-dependent NAD kinase
MKKSVGIIINPIAGLGGRVGLKGSDGADTVDLALALGAKPESPYRAGKAFEQLLEIQDTIDIFTCSGSMGEKTLTELGFTPTIVSTPASVRTTAKDTIEAAKCFKELDVDLILFAGGDGTARNICEAVGLDIPVIGIPAGVKIHSAVYAINPRNAGLAAREYLESKTTGLRESEVMDIDEELFREGRVSAKLFGYMNVPNAQSRIQNMKSGGGSDKGDLAGMAGYIVTLMQPDTIYIIGPGSTTRSIMEELGLPNTLLGVDVVKDGKLLVSDATENQIWDLIEDKTLEARIVVTIIGGQGYIFGRGNQQISPRIIRRIGKKNIMVAATATKLIALKYQPLLVDTGDAELDEELSGFIEVFINFAQTSMYAVRG